MEEKMESTMMDAITANAGNDVELRGYKVLARMQSITYAVKDALAVAFLKDEEFEELLAFMQVSDAEELGEACPDETVFKYRTVNGTPLKGLMKFGDDEVEVDFKNLPEDHMIPEVIEAQRRFVIHRMMAKFRKKLVMLMSRDLTRMEIGEMRFETVQRLARLADVLVDGMTAEELAQNGWAALRKRVADAMTKN